MEKLKFHLKENQGIKRIYYCSFFLKLRVFLLPNRNFFSFHRYLYLCIVVNVYSPTVLLWTNNKFPKKKGPIINSLKKKWTNNSIIHHTLIKKVN